MPFLQSAELRSEVHAYLPLRGLECDPLQVGGVEDHVHILCGLSRKISLAELIKDLKTIRVGLIQVSLRPFRANLFIGRFPGLKPRAEFL